MSNIAQPRMIETIYTTLTEMLSAHNNKICFFFGAGTSVAIDIPDILRLTSQLFDEFTGDSKLLLEKLKDEIGGTPNIEQILDRIRVYCDLIQNAEALEINGYNESSLKELDQEICKFIFTKLNVNLENYDITPHVQFSNWIKKMYEDRIYPVEIYTPNYDLVFEKAMEEQNLPIFDGFIGSNSPFFYPKSTVPNLSKSTQIPSEWTLLWKVHGSINWIKSQNQVVKIFVNSDTLPTSNLVIYPSKLKYHQSKKIPYFYIQDRLREKLMEDKMNMIIIGYSMADAHLNEIIYHGLEYNKSLNVFIIPFSEISADLQTIGETYSNFTICGPKKLILKTKSYIWSDFDRSSEIAEICWNENDDKFSLGDFKAFCKLLEKITNGVN